MTEQAWRPERPGARPQRGLLDTSVIIDLGHARVVANGLPVRSDISAVTLAELAQGPHGTDDADERARRQDLLLRTQALFDPLPFDGRCAIAYGRIAAAAYQAGRSTRTRVADLLIAATALAHGVPLYTRNAQDFVHLAQLVDIAEL